MVEKKKCLIWCYEILDITLKKLFVCFFFVFLFFLFCFCSAHPCNLSLLYTCVCPEVCEKKLQLLTLDITWQNPWSLCFALFFFFLSTYFMSNTCKFTKRHLTNNWQNDLNNNRQNDLKSNRQNDLNNNRQNDLNNNRYRDLNNNRQDDLNNYR